MEKVWGLVGWIRGDFRGGSLGIKAGFMKGQLSKNNAMDQGKTSEQVFFLYIYIYSRSMAGIVLRYFFNIFFDPSWKC